MKKLIGAGALGFLALFMVLGFLTADPELTASTIVAVLLTIGVPAAAAGLLVRSHHADRSRLTGRKAQLRMQTIEAETMKLAIRKGGRLTAVEVAMEMALSPEEAKEVLDGLARREQAELEVTDEGLIVYNFQDLRGLGGKDSARGLLDG